MTAAVMKMSGDAPTMQRQSLCLSGPVPGIAIHAGEDGFRAGLDKYFRKSESNTAERLVDLKAELKALDSEAFWSRLMAGMTSICGAQFGFVSKRILVDDHNIAVEMPPIGEVGSCLMGVALYWNNSDGNENLHRDYKYYAWDAPCAYMKHDKVFLCPEGLCTFITDNPNQLPFECEAYLGVPLFSDGKCFAHFGLMWTKDGLVQKQDLSWSYVEMVLHALEDQITERLISGRGFAKSNSLHRGADAPPAAATSTLNTVVPKESVTAAQSLKPYARSLSHELRTPMQGVVGMLDIMHATVQEQIEGVPSSQFRNIFQVLKENIETVQDSSKRAVEAADNVVYAYDLNMQIPDTPSQDLESSTSSTTNVTGYFDSRPKISQSKIVNPAKRKISSSGVWTSSQPTKIRHVEGPVDSPRTPTGEGHVAMRGSPSRPSFLDTPGLEIPSMELGRHGVLTPLDSDTLPSPSVRHSSLRDLLPVIINESLRVGGRPDSAITEPTEFGEKIEVRTRSSNGHASQKLIEWLVEPDVPDAVAIDERDLFKLISAVFLNAVKFTESGSIKLHARLSHSRRFVLVDVVDTGSGIPEDFQPELFKPFSKEDHSITRSKEGLGLGLLVAKGLARRTGGDILLVRSQTAGPDHGTEFEIRIPLETPSRSNTPFPQTPEYGLRRTPQTNPRPVTEDLQAATTSPGEPGSPLLRGGPSLPTINKLIAAAAHEDRRPSIRRRVSSTPRMTPGGDLVLDKKLAQKFPLRFLVAEDNKINRKLLVNMLGKLGYKDVHEAFDGREAVRVVENLLKENAGGQQRDAHGKYKPVLDVVLMDLWMPEMDGYEATEHILDMYHSGRYGAEPVVLAVSADVTEAAVDRATRIGMQGYMTKPYKLTDLQRLILEFCASKAS